MSIMKKMLITGGEGFIGANFVHYTVKNYPDYEVTVIDKLTYAGDKSNLDPSANKITFVQGDICDKDLMDKVIWECDKVFHFAALVWYTNSVIN